ncbi:sensor histidine kinase [Devriesea agamarum]|uniref:sensor histidine kinase n=1 Tax=Devriesea agamarum TaxID=472569 RepID=UPI00071C2683|nr:histidine kinase [Devriesea agamarum]
MAGRELCAAMRRTMPADRVLAGFGLLIAGLYWVIALSPDSHSQDLVDVVMAIVNTGLAICLLIRNVFPISVAVATGIWLAIMAGTDLLTVSPLSTSPLLITAPLVLLTLTRYAPSHVPGIIALVIGVVGSLISPVVQSAVAPGWAYAAHVAVLAVAYLWGRWRRQESEFRERELEANAELARAEERNRLIAELHDILGHSLTVIYAQANAQVARNSSDPDTRESLRAIRDVSKSALGDLRSLVGSTASTADSPPTSPPTGIVQIPNLLTSARMSGIEIRAQIPDGPGLLELNKEISPRTSLTITRCVQEGLTNVLRHGDSAHGIDIELSRDSRQIALRISNAIPQHHRERPGSSGLGLKNLRARVTALGGHIEIGQAERNQRMFEMKVYLPLEGASYGKS